MTAVKASLDSFLDSGKSGVIAIKGVWGAGKTFFVRHYLQHREELAQKHVSFVSLFGLSSVEEVRRQIIPSALSAKALREGKNLFPYLREFVATFNPNASEAEWREIGIKLFGALQRLAKRDKFTRTKVLMVLGIPAAVLDSKIAEHPQGS